MFPTCDGINNKAVFKTNLFIDMDRYTRLKRYIIPSYLYGGQLDCILSQCGTFFKSDFFNNKIIVFNKMHYSVFSVLDCAFSSCWRLIQGIKS